MLFVRVITAHLVEIATRCVQGAAKVYYPPKTFCSFLSSRLELQSEILLVHMVSLCTCNSLSHIISLKRFDIISISLIKKLKGISDIRYIFGCY